MPSTIFTQNIHEIKNFFKNHPKVIVKPIHGHGGNDIYLFNKFNKNLINKIIKKRTTLCAKNFYQKYLRVIKEFF